MKFLKNLLRNIGILIIILLGVAWYLGWFSKTTIEEQQKGPYTIAYIEHTGAYSKVGPAMDTIYKTIQGEGIQTTQGIGIYYNDPATVKTEELKSDIGVIIDQQDFQKLNLNADAYNVKNITAKEYIVSTFALKNELSYSVGMMKIYPAITKYMEEKGYSQDVERIEIYDMSGSIIYYLAEKIIK